MSTEIKERKQGYFELQCELRQKTIKQMKGQIEVLKEELAKAKIQVRLKSEIIQSLKQKLVAANNESA